MTLAELRARWEERRDEYARLDVRVHGAKLVDQLLGELQQLGANRDDDLLGLTHAATACDYSADHLGRLVRDGTLTNYGRPRAPRVRRGDLPRKTDHASTDRDDPACAEGTAGVRSPSQIARSLVTDNRRTR